MKRNVPNSRKAKNWIKRYLRRSGLKVLAKHGRLFIVSDKARFACIRYYGWAAIRQSHEAVDRMIVEHSKPQKHHSLWF